MTTNLISILSYSQQPISPLVESYKNYKILKEKTPFNVDFIQLGPVKNSARVESIQLDEENPGTMYVAFGSGNLWKTVNNGMSWKPILNEIPSIGIGDIAIAPSNKNILYVGTGESLKKGRNFTMPGTGIYKSLDGGETWLHKGLDDITQILFLLVFLVTFGLKIKTEAFLGLLMVVKHGIMYFILMTVQVQMIL